VTTPRARLASPPSHHEGTKSRRPVFRTASRVAAVGLAVGVVLAASPATADVPSGWPDPDDISLLEGLLVYVFAPLGLILFITLAVVTPSLVKGERATEGPVGDQWFGGRRGGPNELESGTSDRTTGGASGSW
jgi:hypothetical protein